MAYYDLERETEINHTYHINIELGNMSRCQLKEFMQIIDELEHNGVNVLKESIEND